MTLIKYSTALLAKERGFSEITSEEWVIDPNGEPTTISDWEKLKNKWDKEYYSPAGKENPFFASTQESLAKWLRDKHNIIITMIPKKKDEFYYGLHWLNELEMVPIHYKKDRKGKYEEIFEIALVDALTHISGIVIKKIN